MWSKPESDGRLSASKWPGAAQANAREHSSLAWQAHADLRASPKMGTDLWLAERPNQPLLHRVPADRAALQPRKTDSRNGGTTSALSVAVDTRSRCQPDAPGGTMAREAKARGKAAG
jgi:hypothetical protein